MLYYIAGPLVAVVISLKYTESRIKAHHEECCGLVNEKIELVKKGNEEHETEMLKKVMTTVMPIAKAVNKLNNEVGLR